MLSWSACSTLFMQMQTVAPCAPAISAEADQWLNLKQAAARAVCNESTLRRLIRAGLLRHARVGVGRKHIRLRASWVDAALEAAATPIEGSR